MSACSVCNRPLKSPEAIAAGMGEVCRQLVASGGGASSVKLCVRFMYHRPDTGARSWRVTDGQSTYFVTLTGGVIGDRIAKCTCGADDKICAHITVTAEHDNEFLKDQIRPSGEGAERRAMNGEAAR